MTASPRDSAMASPKLRGLVLAGVILLILGGLSLAETLNTHPYQSTFNVLPGKFLKILANLRDQTQVSGSFRETSGKPVNFTILSSVQFAAFQVGQPTANLYSIVNAPSANVNFLATLPDTYYLVFTHGPGYLNATETVYFTRTYMNLDLAGIAQSAVLFALGAVELVWGVRAGRPKKSPYAANASLPPPPP